MRVPAVVAAVACTALLAGCGSAGGATTGRPVVAVVASTSVYGDIAAQVAGRIPRGRVSITSIISDPAADPHSFEPSTRTQLELSRATLVIENGGGYDDFVDRMLRAVGPRTVIDAVHVSGRASGPDLNEHVWYDLPTVVKVVAAVTTALVAQDPRDAATFRTNAAVFVRGLKSIEAAEAQVRRAYAGTGAAVTEPLPAYLLAACGLVVRTPRAFSAAVEDGTDVAPSALRQTLHLFSAGTVRVLAYNAQTYGVETARVLAAARAAHVPVVPMSETLPPGQHYLAWMRQTVASLAAALR